MVQAAGAVLVLVLALCVLFFAIAQARIAALAAAVRRARKAAPRSTGQAGMVEPAVWPHVVVELPVYRESRALPRLLDAVTRLDYPAGRLGVQVLDDSDDAEERGACWRVVDGYRDGPVPVSYLHRSMRTGFKSGALNAGAARLDSELVAVFDADFVPNANFLRRTVPRFADPRVVCVHSRWRHPADQHSSLAALQSAVLDSLFCFQSAVREKRGESSMYLGTCGVWRRSAVVELGGWKEVPFTDDGIDLSFRARAAGRAVVFVDEPLASADLPETWVAFKNQQRRWARGAFRLILDHGGAALGERSGAKRYFLELSSLHLVLSTPVLVLAGMCAATYVLFELPRTIPWMVTVIALTVALLVFPPVQECILSQRMLHRHWVRRSARLLPAIPLALGVAVSIVAGFCDTLARNEPEFVRTPKRGAAGVATKTRAGWNRAAGVVMGVELVLAAAFTACARLAVVHGYPEAVALTAALGVVFILSAARTATDLLEARSFTQG